MIYIESNPDEMLLGFYYTNGTTELGEDIRIFSIGFILFSININF